MTSPHKIVIKSDTSELKKVEIFLREFFEVYNISMVNFNNVLLCISEAVVNSIQHGNKNDKDKTVSIEIECGDKIIKVVVKDQGKGFNLEDVTDPTIEQNIKKESGRGIHIIKSLTKNLEYNIQGNFIQFKIYCE